MDSHTLRVCTNSFGVRSLITSLPLPTSLSSARAPRSLLGAMSAAKEEMKDTAASAPAVVIPPLNCAVCNSSDRGVFVSHPLVHLPVCPSCARRIEGVDWTVDEDGTHEWCTVCADGGEMFLCDKCGRAICYEDCEDIVGEEYRAKCAAADEWQCWVCDPTPIRDQQAAMREYLAIPESVRRETLRAAREHEADERRRKKREKQIREGVTRATATGRRNATQKRGLSEPSKVAPDNSSTEDEGSAADEPPATEKKQRKKKNSVVKKESIDLRESEAESDEKPTPRRSKGRKRQRLVSDEEEASNESATSEEDDDDSDGEEGEKNSSRGRSRDRDRSSKKKSKKPKKESVKKERTGRKAIRDLIDDSKLTRTTQEAIQAEAARIKRLTERNAAAAAADDDVDVVVIDDDTDVSPRLLQSTRVCINPSHGPREAAWYIPEEIASHMKPHQIAGVRFMWDVIVESVSHARDQSPSRGLGCLLAHFCGLGKTMMCIAFLFVYLQGRLGRHALVVAPVNTLQNWVAEFTKWLSKRNRLDVWCLDSCTARHGKKVQAVRFDSLKAWKKHGGVMIVGYEGYRAIWQATTKHMSKAHNLACKKLLLETPDIIVADEGHRVKDSKSTLARALADIRTQRRIVLTGTPLQNNTREYYTMINFVRPNFLGSEAEFRNRFDAPIRNGQCLDSTESDVRLMKSRIHVLHKKLEPLVHRVDYDMLAKGGRYSSIDIDTKDNSDIGAKSPAEQGTIADIRTLPTKHECQYRRWHSDHDVMRCRMWTGAHPSCLFSFSPFSRRGLRPPVTLPASALPAIHPDASNDALQGVSRTHAVGRRDKEKATHACAHDCRD